MSLVHLSHAIDDDLLLPTEPEARRIARAIYDVVRDAPVVSPHGHLEAAMLARDEHLSDPATLLITSDHYVLRLLHASGVALEQLGVVGPGGGEVAEPREVWRRFAEHSRVFNGTATGVWLEHSLRSQFGATIPDVGSADETFDALSELLSGGDFRPRRILERARVEVVTTTDALGASLDAHSELTSASFRVLPTLRPDRLIDPTATGWHDEVMLLTADAPSFPGIVAALNRECLRFRAAGATAVDLGVVEARSENVPRDIAQRALERILGGVPDADDIKLVSAALTHELARACRDAGLTLMIHAGVLRGHHRPTSERFGPDTGHDMPLPTSFLGLRPMLEEFGDDERFRVVLFTVDEATWSREIVPLSGFYPSVYAGAPWWFLDSPDALLRFRSVLTEGAGFSRYSGFIDDARSPLSIATRHDVARRVDATFLARLVRERRISLESAVEVACDTVGPLPKRVFGL